MLRLAVACLLALILVGSALGARQHSQSTAATTLKIKAVGAIAYNVKSLRAKAGVVKIVMTNTSPLKHDVAIKGKGVNAKGKLVAKGGTSTAMATLKPGAYVFYCTVPGHAGAGMKGVLTIK